MTDSSSRAETRNENQQVVEPPGVTPGGLRRLLQGVRNPLWRPLVLKLASVTAGMLGLAGIGIFSTLNEIDAGVAPAQLREGTWLAGELNPADRPAENSPTADSPSTAGAATTTVRAASLATINLGHRPGNETTRQSKTETRQRLRPGLTPDGKVILNTASAEQLQRLPGVGEKRAQKIVELRERLKRFRRTTDLLRVRGIGVKSLRKMLPHLVLDPPPEPEPEVEGSDAGASSAD